MVREINGVKILQRHDSNDAGCNDRRFAQRLIARMLFYLPVARTKTRLSRIGESDSKICKIMVLFKGEASE